MWLDLGDKEWLKYHKTQKNGLSKRPFRCKRVRYDMEQEEEMTWNQIYIYFEMFAGWVFQVTFYLCIYINFGDLDPLKSIKIQNKTNKPIRVNKFPLNVFVKLLNFLFFSLRTSAVIVRRLGEMGSCALENYHVSRCIRMFVICFFEFGSKCWWIKLKYTILSRLPTLQCNANHI